MIRPSDCLACGLGVDDVTGLPGVLLDPDGGLVCVDGYLGIACPPPVTSAFDPPGTYANVAAVNAAPCVEMVRAGCTTDGKPYLTYAPLGALTEVTAAGSVLVGPWTMSNTAAFAGLPYAPILTLNFSVPCKSRIFVAADWAALGRSMSDNAIYPTGPPKVVPDFRIDGGPWQPFSTADYVRSMTTGTLPWNANQSGLTPFHGQIVNVGAHTIDMRVRYEKNETGTATLLAETKGMYLRAHQI